MAMFGMLGRRAASTPTIFTLLGAGFRSAPTGGDGMRPRSPPPTPAAGGGAATERIGGSCTLPSIGAAALGGKNAGLASPAGATSGLTASWISRTCVGGGGATSGRTASWISPTRVGGGGPTTTELRLLPASMRRAVGGEASLGSGSKVAALTSADGAPTSRPTILSSRACVGSRAPYGRAATGLHSSLASGLLSTRSYSWWSSKKKLGDCSSSVEEKLTACTKIMKLLQEKLSSNHKITQMTQKLLKEPLDLSRAIQLSLGKGSSYTRILIRCIVTIVVIYGVLSLLAMGILMVLDVPNVISKQEFAEKVTQFAYTAMTLIVASNGKCSQATLLKKMNGIGFDEEKVNLQMLTFLVNKGYLKKETATSQVMGIEHFYSVTPDMIQFCESGEMMKYLAKAAKKVDSLEKMLLAQD